MSDELWRWRARRLVAAIRSRTVSSRDVVQAHLDRIDAVNPRLNALTAVFAETALEAADAADRAVASGRDLGSLHGLPITVKDNIDVAGAPTSQGVVGLKDWMPPGDAPVVRHLKDAGAIILGRTNMPDYGLRWHTDNDLHGPTRNPWNAAKTPGGSSGGEAAALATGMTPLGIGNDMGGSTRQPAVSCGVTGLRPTTGRVSRFTSALFSDPPMFYGRVACVNGPMARCVDDLRLALGVMARPDPGDPEWTPGVAPPDPGHDRIGIVRDPSGNGVDPVVAAALDRAVTVLAEAGYRVEEVDAPLLDEADETIQRLAETEFSGPSDLPPGSADMEKIFADIMAFEPRDGFTYHRAVAEQYRIAAAWSRLMDRHPLIIGPVSTLETFDVGFDLGGAAAVRRLVRSFRLTELCNLLGLPSVALPAAVDGGIPHGVQVIGRPFDEARCFDAAEIIERATGPLTPIEPRTP